MALAQVSVFEGSFSLAAAEAVLDLPHIDVPGIALDVLQGLVEKSLVRRRPDTRFDMLVSLREYASEHLRTVGRYPGSGPDALDAASTRHASYFARFKEADARASASADLDNFVAACRYSVECHHVQQAVETLEVSWAALRLRGPFSICLELCEHVRARLDLDKRDGARVDRIRGWALRVLGRRAEALEALQRALSDASNVGDTAIAARVHSQLGDVFMVSGDVEAARRQLDTALRLSRDIGDACLECEVLGHRGNVCEAVGELGRARSDYAAQLALARAMADRRLEAASLGNLGTLFANQGKIEDALESYQAALAIERDIGSRQLEGDTLCNLGLLRQVQGNFEEARRCLLAALSLARDMGYARLGAVVMCNLGIVEEAMDRTEDARKSYRGALRAAREIGDKRFEGQCLTFLGGLDARTGDLKAADASLTEAERLLTAVSDRLSLGLLHCFRAEASYLMGDNEVGQKRLRMASAVASELGAEATSELGVALARVGRLVGGVASRSNLNSTNS